MEAAAGVGVGWLVWRVVLSPHVPDGLAAVRRRWAFRDLVEAHAVLDVVEALTPAPDGGHRAR